MTEIFVTFLGISLSVSVLAVLLMAILPFVGRRYASKWIYWIWIVLAVRLLIPFSGSLPEKQSVTEVQPIDVPRIQSTEVNPAETHQLARIVITIPPQITEPIVADSAGKNGGVSLLDIAASVWLV